MHKEVGYLVAEPDSSFIICTFLIFDHIGNKITQELLHLVFHVGATGGRSHWNRCAHPAHRHRCRFLWAL